MLTVLGGLAEFERELIRARTGEGRKRAKASRVKFGRPAALTPQERQEAIHKLAQGEAQADVARSFTACSRLTAMGLIAPVLMGIVLFYWLAFCFTVAAWLKTIVHLLGGNFTRSALWFTIGCGMLFWWTGSDVSFDTWLGGSAMIVGMGVLAMLIAIFEANAPTAQQAVQPTRLRLQDTGQRQSAH
jgi:hypothetical protein